MAQQRSEIEPASGAGSGNGPLMLLVALAASLVAAGAVMAFMIQVIGYARLPVMDYPDGVCTRAVGPGVRRNCDFVEGQQQRYRTPRVDGKINPVSP